MKKIGVIGTGCIGGIIMSGLIDRNIGIPEIDILEDITDKRKDLTGIILCADIGGVQDFAMNFRENILGIISSGEINNVYPLNLGIVFTGENIVAKEIIDNLKLEISEILGIEDKISLELLSPNDLKKKKIVTCGGYSSRVSDLIMSIESRKLDIGDVYMPEKNYDWKTSSHQSRKSQFKSTNSKFKNKSKVR